MNQDTLSKVWSAMTTAAAYLTLNAFFQTQGWTLLLPGPNFGTTERYSATIYGIAVPWAIWMCVLGLIIIHAKRYGGSSLVSRLPVAFNIAITPSDWLGRAYVYVMCTALCFLPMLLNIQLILKFFGGSYFKLSDCSFVGVGFLAQLASWSYATLDYDYVFGQCAGERKGAAYYPGITVTVLLVMEVSLAILLIATIIVLSRSRKTR